MNLVPHVTINEIFTTKKYPIYDQGMFNKDDKGSFATARIQAVGLANIFAGPTARNITSLYLHTILFGP